MATSNFTSMEWKRLGNAPHSIHLAFSIATGYGVGFATGQPLPATVTGILVGAAILAAVLIRSPWHKKARGQDASGAA